MATKLTVFEKQTTILNQFERAIRNNERNPLPTVIELDMAATAKIAARKPFVKQAAAPRISFYNPNNLLNGFGGKTKADQLDIKEAIKANAKLAKKK